MKYSMILVAIAVFLAPLAFADDDDLAEAFTALQNAEAVHQNMYQLGLQGSVDLPLELPLPAKAGEEVIRMLAGYEPYMEALSILEEMDKTASRQRVESELKNALKSYTELFRNQVTIVLTNWEATKANRDQCVGIGYSSRLTPNPDGSPTLEGARIKSLALLGLIARLDLDDSAEMVRDSVQMALAQRLFCGGLNNDDAPPGYWSSLLTSSSIYIRQILSTAMLSTVDDPAKRSSLVTKIGLRSDDPRYGGDGEEEDLPVCMEVTDDQFDDLVEAVFPGLISKVKAAPPLVSVSATK